MLWDMFVLLLLWWTMSSFSTLLHLPTSITWNTLFSLQDTISFDHLQPVLGYPLAVWPCLEPFSLLYCNSFGPSFFHRHFSDPLLLPFDWWSVIYWDLCWVLILYSSCISLFYNLSLLAPRSPFLLSLQSFLISATPSFPHDHAFGPPYLID